MFLLRWIAGSLLTLTLLLALAIIVAPRVIDPNDYRQAIIDLVQDQTGRALRLDGDLTVSLFPWIGVHTQDLALSQPDGIAGDMLQVESAQVRVKLLPLFSRRAEIDTLVFEAPRMTLITLENGFNSFSGLSATTDEIPTNNASKGTAAAVALVIQGIQLSDASLLWDDRQADQKIHIQQLNIHSGNLLTDELVDLTADGTITYFTESAPVKFDLSMLARIDIAVQGVTARSVKLTAEQSAMAAHISSAELTFSQASGLQLSNTQLTAELLENTSSNQPAPLLSNVEALIKTISLDADLEALNLSGIEASTQIGKRKLALSSDQLNAHLGKQSADIEALQIISQDLQGKLEGLAIRQMFDQPRLSGAVDFQPFNAATLLEDIAFDYQPKDSKALTNVAFKAKFKANPEQFYLSETRLKLDQSEMVGWFSLNDFDQPAIKFAVQLDNLNLDNYLPGSAELADNQVTTSDAAALAIPMALLKGLDANGSFKANQLISGGMEFNQVDVQIVSTPVNITVTPKATLYQGALGGNMVYTEQGDESKLRVNNSIDLINLSEFLQAADVSNQLSGIGTLKLDLQVTEKNGVQSRQGTIKLLASNGVLKGFGFKEKLDQIYASLEKPTAQTSEVAEGESEESQQTQFADLSGTFYLTDNLLSNQDFELHAPLFRVAGQGTIDLATEEVDYQLTLFTKSGASGVNQAFVKLEGIPIPIRLRGSLYAPSYSIDFKALLQALAEQKISEKKGAYLQEKLGLEGGDKLSSKQILQQLLIHEANKKLHKKRSQDNPDAGSQAQVPAPYQQDDSNIGNTDALEKPPAEPQDEQVKPRELTKKEARDERNRRLLELLLGGSEQDGDE